MMRQFPQALFLDRDGTLIEWVHYLSDPREVRLVDGVTKALMLAKEAGCLLFLHTNQSGVGRGYFGENAVLAVNKEMYRQMGVGESFFDGVCIATDSPDALPEGTRRKPSPRYELEMAGHYGLNPESCYVIGDSLSDVETGLRAGMSAALVRSGQELTGTVPDGVLRYDSISDAIDDLFSARPR